MINKSKLVKLLLALAEAVDSSSDEEIEALGKAGVSRLFSEVAQPKRMVTKRPAATHYLEQSKIAEIVAEMRDLSSREDAIKHLASMEFSRKSLEQIARRIDIPVFREDTSKRLMERIVESTVGPRLNAEAIRGEILHR